MGDQLWPAGSRHARSAPPLPVAVTVEHAGFVNLALANSGIPLVDRIAVTNLDDSALVAVTVRASVLDVSGAALATPWERTIQAVPAGAAMPFEAVDLQPDPAALLGIEERRPGRLVVEVFDDEREVRVERRLDVLAHHQWLRFPAAPTLSLELLAAFAQPNSPAVAELLVEARDLLKARTGSPSTEGYQDDPERTDEIAEAIYGALQARTIAYSNPPASWDQDGQKVRTPAQVLNSDRAGTCLDTTVLFAGALEQAGLHPLLWLVPGHIFVGWWREESRRLPQTVVLEQGALLNHLDLDHLGVVETTALTDRPEPVTFADARRYAAGNARNDESLGIVDVRLARVSGVGPLPALTRDAGGALVVTVQAPAARPEHTAPPVTPASSPRRRSERESRPEVPTRVRRWKNALLDLSLRNKLIHLPPGASATRLAVPENGGLAAVEDVLHGGGRLALRAADDIDDVLKARGAPTAWHLPDEMLGEGLRRRQLHSDQVGDAHGSRMRSLQRKARTLREESGSANLYLALGTLEWSLQGKPLRSPLLLLPVTVTPGRRSSEPATMTLDEGAETTPNLCLLEKLRTELDLELPDLAEPPVDEHGIDVAATLRAVREALDAAELPFAVRETLDLGVLQFATFVLWKDLDEHWTRFVASPLVRHLVQSPTEPFDDDSGATPPDPTALDAVAAVCPVTADASQLDAVARAEAGRTFVLEGPPGTGKSQTITNVLARTMAQGKRVLFVAEKRAALEVVRSRLDAIGLGALCLDLHDKASRPQAVREQLRRALDADFAPDVEGHRRAHDDVTGRARALVRYAGALHTPNAAGHSLYGAHDAVLARGDGPALPVSAAFVGSATGTTLDEIRRSLPDVADLVWQVGPRRHHAWGFVRGRVDRGPLLHATSMVDEALRELASAPRTLSTLVHTAATARELHLVAEFARPGRPPLALLDEVSSTRWQQASTDARKQLTDFARAPRPLLDTATPDVLDLPLDQLRAEAVAARDGSFLGRKKKQLAIVESLRPGLRPGAELDPAALVGFLDEALALREEARLVGAGAASLPGVGLPRNWSPLRDEVRALPVGRIDELWKAARRLGDVPAGPFRDALRAHLADRSAGDPRWVGPLDRLATGVAVAAESGNDDDGAAALDRWRDGAALLEAWSADATRRRGELLGRWSELRALLDPLVAHASGETADAVLAGDVDAEDVVDGFERGLARASFDERLKASGLEDFDAAAHQRTIRRFDDASAELRAHLRTVLPQEIVARRETTSSTALGVVRREANKKRGPSVRRLMAQHGDAILAVTPCVLVSPESLARFVDPTSAPFDLVVFDEASQIRVADAIGALGRARAAIVVGDSRQMPPTAFGGAGQEDGEPGSSEEQDVPDDEESILSECVQARVPQSWLSWHYRSQDESLIAFSNRLYYDGRLASFPAPPGRGTGVSFRRVDGTFVRSGRVGLRTNPIEARAVVDEVLTRFARSPGEPPSLGVVTFNVQQRDLIDELLRAADDPAVAEALDRDDDRGLFVKNLENVQGDERDAVLFSIGFSRNDKGVLPLNFGPLNRVGGERRLNVAVTRARREVVVFCSFDPADLRDSSAVGVGHLRAYLEMAARGVAASGDVAPAPSPTDRHRDDVAAALRESGLVVRTDVGLSDFRLDLTLAHGSAPDDPVVAVLLDGPGWASRRTVGDRDGMPRVVLGDVLGWPAVERVWLPQWLDEHDQVVERLVAAVEAARPVLAAPAEPDTEADTENLALAPARPVFVEDPPTTEVMAAPLPAAPLTNAHAAHEAESPAVPPPPAAPRAPAAADEGSPADDGALVFTPWSPAAVGERSVLDELDRPAAADRVRAVVADVVAVEAPIELKRLTRLVAGSFGLERVRQERHEAILALLPRDVQVDRVDGFAWPSHRHRRSWRGYRVSDDAANRPLPHIPLTEIANAMEAARARLDLAWDTEELLRATLAVFGAKRLTDGAWSRLDEARRLARNRED